MMAVVRRTLFVLLLCPLLAAADDGPPVPTGHDLLRLPAEEVRGYVTGLYEGQLVMAM